MIYATSYNITTLEPTAASAPSGFADWDELRMVMGEPDYSHPRMLTYAGVAYTDFVLSVDTRGIFATHSHHEPTLSP